jgi:mannose-6-phosphate isomerase class I
MGLGWDVALDMIDYAGRARGETLARARQAPTAMRVSHGSREVSLFQPDVLEFFDTTRLEVSDELEVDAGRFSIAIVTAGDGMIEGEFGSEPIAKGQTFACAASLAHRYRVGASPLEVVRCMGPAVDR